MPETPQTSPSTEPPLSPEPTPARRWADIGAALQQKEFRYLITGSFLSNIGSWMQSMAQAWLVLQLTNSPFYLGLDGFAGTVPITLFAFGGGVVADRFDRRRMLLATQWAMLALALILGLMTQFKLVRVGWVILFSFFTGMAQSIAWPVYQTAVGDIARPDNLSNAIALNSTQFNLARLIGPLAGALGLSFFGTAGCFYANALSFVALIYALSFIRFTNASSKGARQEAGWIQSFRQALAYMASETSLAWLLFLIAVSTILGTPLITLLPIFARDILQIGPSGLGLLVGSFGAGAVIGGLTVAFLGNVFDKGRFIMISIFLYVIGMVGFALSRFVPFSMICLGLAGFSMVGFAAVVNAHIQLTAPDHLRGRAISLLIFTDFHEPE
ncbi:MAG: MFS transporter [Acidobacteria bacterium]|nr:MFS transporter [Acidobacteriota bacterium]MBI3658185.1 MFS transporter [Acidobacteriota bacterium]